MTAPKTGMALEIPTTNGHDEPVEPVSLSEFRTNTRTTRTTWAGAEIVFAYKPGALDADHFDQLRQDKDLPISDWVVKYCMRVIAAIPGICTDDHQPLPITEENLRKLPTGLLNGMVSAISEDLIPKETPASSSNGSSPPTAPMA